MLSALEMQRIEKTSSKVPQLPAAQVKDAQEDSGKKLQRHHLGSSHLLDHSHLENDDIS